MATYKIDGVKFGSMEDLKEALMELYKDKMSAEELEKYIQENTETKE